MSCSRRNLKIFGKGEKLFDEESATDRANRFICSSDSKNAELAPAWPFFIKRSAEKEERKSFVC